MTIPALEDYRQRAQSSPITEYPLLWAGHYSSRLLGSYGSHNYPEEKIGEMVLGLMAPFGICDEVHESWLVIDGSHVRPFQRLLFISGLRWTGSGIGIIHYVAPYRIEDWGKTWIGEPVQSFYHAPAVHRALEVVTERRLEPPSRVAWADAYVACLESLEQI